MQNLSFTNLKNELIKNTPLYPVVEKLFTLCTYTPNANTVRNTIEHYLSDEALALLGITLDEKLIGIIGLLIKDSKGIIKHISVLQEMQKKGIGTKALKSLSLKYGLKKLYAETDADSVGFYIKQNFLVTELPNNLYPTSRYSCTLKI